MAWLVRVALSVAGGGVLYGAWLAVVFGSMSQPSSPRPFLVMLTAPIVTAFGLGTVAVATREAWAYGDSKRR